MLYSLMAVNILSADFKPSVTRRGLTDEQKQVLSYALGRAMHRYLLNMFPDDEEITGALKRLFTRYYFEDNLLCS